MSNTATELIVTNINKNFKLVYEQPNMDLDRELSYFQELCSRKILAYQNLEEVGKAHYSIVARKADKKLNQKVLKVNYVMDVMTALIKSSPQSFELFSMNLWKEFINSIFEVLPTHPRIMNTFSNIEGLDIQNDLPKDCCSKQVVEILIESNKDVIELIRSDYHNYLKDYNEAYQLIRSQTNEAMSQIIPG